jgi:hypothetical protein
MVMQNTKTNLEYFINSNLMTHNPERSEGENQLLDNRDYNTGKMNYQYVIENIVLRSKGNGFTQHSKICTPHFYFYTWFLSISSMGWGLR